MLSGFFVRVKTALSRTARVFFYHRGVIDQKIGYAAADHTKAGNCDLLHWILLLVVRHRENLAQRLMV